jgi:type I restriction enzyme S subunit
MGKWSNKKVKELCHIGRGRVISQEEIQNNPGVYPVYSSQSMNKGEMGRIDSYDFEGEYVTWTTDGAYAGTVFHREGKFNCTNVCGILKAKENDKIDLLFLSYLLSTQAKKYVSYVGNPKLMNGVMAEIDLTLPESKPEQTRIAQILSTIDRAIAQTEALIAKYQRIKTGLMQDLLTRGIDEHGRIRSKATHRFVVKNGIEVPEEWEILEIGEITEYVGSGITPKGGSNVYGHEGILLIRSQNVLVGEFSLEDVAYIAPEINDRMQRSELQELDVLLNITGASLGRSHFVPFNFPKSNVNQHVCALRIKNRSLGKSLFISSFLNSYQGQKQIKRLLGASNREGLNYQQIREIKLPMPKLEDDAEYQKIYAVFNSINKKLETLKANLKKQTYLKTGLMQDLLSGRVRVKVKEETEAC